MAAGWRVVGLLLGLALTLGGAGAVLLNGVNAVRGTGLVGTRGTFRVDYCIDQAASSRHADYTCDGEFTATGGSADDAVAGTLDNGADYRNGEKLRAVEAGEAFHYRETGVGETLLSLGGFCFGLLVLVTGYFTWRKWARSFRK